MSYNNEIKKIAKTVHLRAASQGDIEDQIIKLVTQVQMETLGWMYTEACNLCDENVDIRKVIVPTIVDRFITDMAKTSETVDDTLPEAASLSDLTFDETGVDLMRRSQYIDDQKDSLLTHYAEPDKQYGRFV